MFYIFFTVQKVGDYLHQEYQLIFMVVTLNNSSSFYHGSQTDVTIPSFKFYNFNASSNRRFEFAAFPLFFASTRSAVDDLSPRETNEENRTRIAMTCTKKFTTARTPSISRKYLIKIRESECLMLLFQRTAKQNHDCEDWMSPTRSIQKNSYIPT